MRVVVNQFEGIDVTPALPLAAGCLVSSARADERIGEASFRIELERRPLPRVVADFQRPDVLGFSLYPWNADYSLAVAEAARQAYPDCLIVVGGPSVPRRHERARRFMNEHPAVDVLVFAEGESTFCALLAAHADGRDLGEVGGIALGSGRGRAEHAFTTAPGRMHAFSPTASPFLDGTFDELLERHRHHFSMALAETNRGCPFSCTFCDWSLTKHVVEFPIERVHAELRWIAEHGFRHIMLADANFGIRPRDADIARYIAGLRADTGAPTSFYWYLTKNDHERNLETIEILQEANIGTWVGLAVQDFDDDVLEAVKRDNIQTGESLALRQICADRGIPTFNELMLGLPGQTYQSFTETVAQAMPPQPKHDFVLFLCRMIDNTELGDPESRAEHAIETRLCAWKTSTPDWDPIVDERQEVVVGTRDMPVDQWRRAYRFAFFSAALYNLRLLRVVTHFVQHCGAELRDYVQHLVESLDRAEDGTVYGQIHRLLERYAGSILDCGPFVLPLEGSGAPVYVDEAIATAALERYPEFLAETETLTRSFALDAPAETVAEAFRYQDLITPRWQQAERTIVELSHDWPSFVAGGGRGVELNAEPTTVRYAPPAYASVASFAAFAATHFSCIRARLDVGAVEPYGDLGQQRPRQLVVLPASG